MPLSQTDIGLHPSQRLSITIRLMFLVLIDREGSPEFASNGPIFAVDLDDERIGPVEAREGYGISIKLLGQE
jgi:hypothetical protein